MFGFVRAVGVSCVAFGLLACGGEKIGGGKQGAATAFFGALGPSKYNPSASGLSGQGFLSTDIAVDCPKGGKVTLKNFTVNAFSTPMTYGFTMAYDNCSTLTWDDPDTELAESAKVVLGGSMKFTQKLDFNPDDASQGSMEQLMDGRVNFGGPFNDFIEADVSQKIDWSLLSLETGSVSFSLNGTLKTSTDTYTFDNETVNITAGMIEALPEDKP